ncbi:LysM peptidoglycan-binding domain-containing protein [Bernardetia sp.]|uniref:LysM peptidoglycan-binding domain-containing protein n=1 Tax=Bernardetia sp. TaxID=1937974 RepID=UPI0025BDA523|nr:LysM peptidoglycan-binding domain-containing protein [Bernardetia sp.]
MKFFIPFILVFFTHFASHAFSTFRVVKDSVGLERRGNNLYIKHKVTIGEDIYQIARKYGVNKETLITLNPSAKKQLQIGQILYIPHPQTAYRISQLKGYKVRPNETLFSIASKFQTDVKTLKELNELYTTQIQTGQELLIPYPNSHQDLYDVPVSAYSPAKDPNAKTQAAKKYHLVISGETLYSISQKYGVSVENLKKWNNNQTGQINAGQKIIVGQGEGYNEKVFIVASASNTQTQKGKPHSESGVCHAFLSTDKLQAMHRTAPTGTKIRVTLESTGRSVVVEVLGNFPDIDANKNVVIIISRAAARKLGTMSKEFPVYLSWSE